MKTRLSAGLEIFHLDNDPNGHVGGNIATVIRARGQGVLVRNEHGTRYRINRDDVIRIIPKP